MVINDSIHKLKYLSDVLLHTRTGVTKSIPGASAKMPHKVFGDWR